MSSPPPDPPRESPPDSNTPSSEPPQPPHHHHHHRTIVFPFPPPTEAGPSRGQRPMMMSFGMMPSVGMGGPHTIPPPWFMAGHPPPHERQRSSSPGQGPAGNGDHSRAAQPPGPPGESSGAHPTFSFFMPMSSQPDPEKAAELLRSLPTVSDGLLKRVSRIVAAEGGEGGWSCGICLEGDQEAVKALPCNHLYHVGCLEPWLTTRHTCPACRLDLDPMHTLRPPQMRVFRPGPTGGGRPAPHPYAAGGAETNGDAEANGGPPAEPMTFVWRMPIPRPDAQNASTPPTAPHSPEVPQTERPHTPTLVFNVPLHASPLPMERSSGSHGQEEREQSSEGGQDPAPPQDSSLQEAPALQQPSGTHGQAPDAQPVPDFPQVTITQPAVGQAEDIAVEQSADAAEVGAGGPQREGSPAATHTAVQSDVPVQAGTPDQAGQEGPAPDRPQPERRSHVHAHAMPHFHFFLNLPHPEPTAPSKPFIPQPLESWVEQREKALGWRCDAGECLVFADDDDVDLANKSSEAVEMLTIQPAEPGAEACEHRWHRTCLETAERSAGRPRAVEGGKVWVRCQRCEKDGWVPDVEPSPSERETCEVERMVT